MKSGVLLVRWMLASLLAEKFEPISVVSNLSKLFEKANYHLVSEKNVRLPMLIFLSLILFARPLIIMNLAVVYL